MADVQDSVEDLRNGGLANGKPAVMIIIFRQPGANIIETVDRVTRAAAPAPGLHPAEHASSTVVIDRTTTIRASIRDVERTLLHLHRPGHPGGLPLPAQLPLPPSSPAWPCRSRCIGTFGVMYLLDYSLDNLSLMALTIATGFVVDDAIVVIENITPAPRDGHDAPGGRPQGRRARSASPCSPSASPWCAVFIPILLMGGIVGRLFREFAVTLSVAIAVSMVVSLTTTPMMCARLLRPETEERHGRIFQASERVFQWHPRASTRRPCAGCSTPPVPMLMVGPGHLVTNVLLFIVVPKGFFPQQDTGRMMGAIQADQDISFQAMRGRMRALSDIVQGDPDVDHVMAFIGGGGVTNTGRVFLALKPNGPAQRHRRPDHRPAARQAGQGARAPACSCSPSRTSASAAGWATPSTSPPCRATTPRSCSAGRPGCWPGCAA